MGRLGYAFGLSDNWEKWQDAPGEQRHAERDQAEWNSTSNPKEISPPDKPHTRFRSAVGRRDITPA